MSGWEPAEVTTYEYDPQGRLARSITVREPEWTGGEVATLIASRMLDVRGPHGHLLSESTSPLADPNNPASTHHYEAGPTPRVDWAERVRLRAVEKFKTEHKPDNMDGLFFPVRKIDHPKT